MNPSHKRKRSIATAYRPPITPHTAGSNGRLRTPSRASNADSIHAPTSSARQPRTPLATETQPQAEPSERSEDDDFDQFIAAIDMKDYGTVGCAYYSTEEEKLYLLGDSRSGGTETIEACELCRRKELDDN